ncbi:amidohydrolase [Streptomyces griseorubiginosus]|uniref:amidohydrolase n=1 Tax=Streptomyces griseorubiginosus TaxID=67304 RepID=UPI001AD63662|nr:amidohydrolase [Streptomyces griseorubiginosus]MBO4256661.1 amidohydrolase family protein [Streptomyces griseorubiginosus]
MTISADLVFVNGTVRTMDPALPRTDTVAVRNGRIVGLGRADTDELTGARTEMVDLNGGTLIPGFQDAHIHAVHGGLELAKCDLTGSTDAAEYLRRIDAYAEAHPSAEWITGGGWSLEAFPGGLPTAALLDKVVPDRPVFLPNRDHHGAWVNSRALALAGITAATPDPHDGRIERAADGSPTGMLQEGAADLVGRFVPAPTDGELLDALLRSQRMLHSLGITAWQDALVGSGLGGFDVLGTYREAASAGLLTARVRGALWWDRGRGAEQIDELADRREHGSAGRFTAGTVKIMQDGVVENRTAGLLAPYAHHCGEETAGLSFVDPVALRAHVTALDRLGFQVHFHALGDRAVREALDAVEAARAANGPSGNRHHLAHLQIVHPDDIPRFRALDAVANIQPLWAAHEPQMDEFTIPVIGPERARRQYPFAALRAAGARLAAGSDWPVTSPDPISGIHVAVNRILPHSKAEPFLPEQRIAFDTALAAYTTGSAWVNHLDDTGSIVVGSLADLVVLDRDPCAGPPEEIASTKVTATYVEGSAVYTAP